MRSLATKTRRQGVDASGARTTSQTHHEVHDGFETMLFSGLRGQQTTRAGRLKTRSKSLRQQVRRRPSSIQCDAQLEFSELREHRERAGPIFMMDRCCFLTRSSAGSCDLKRLAIADDDTCNSQFTNETACTTGSQGGAPCHWCKSAAVLSSSPGASRAWITHADTATRLGCTFSQSHPCSHGKELGALNALSAAVGAASSH
jgi:hypothetical protein